MTEKKDCLILHANCMPVKGALRSTVCDLQRGIWYYVPNDLYEILTKYNKCPVDDIYSDYEDDNHEVINDYIKFIIDKDLGFIDNDPQCYTSLNLEWDYPGQISNCIIDVSNISYSKFNYEDVISQLDTLNCSLLQFRFFESIDFSILERLLKLTLDTRLNDIRLLLKYDITLDSLLQKHLYKHKRISQVVYFDADNSSQELVKDVQIIKMTREELSPNDCGNVCLSTFSVNIEHFTESLNFNSCLNRKVSIDSMGFIKNCPSQSESFGHIQSDKITETVMDQNFQKLWSIKKDDIQICKDCEHRYICTDCRIFTTSDTDAYSKPKKCSYDPYTATWG